MWAMILAWDQTQAGQRLFQVGRDYYDIFFLKSQYASEKKNEKNSVVNLCIVHIILNNNSESVFSILNFMFLKIAATCSKSDSAIVKVGLKHNLIINLLKESVLKLPITASALEAALSEKRLQKIV